MSLLELKNVSYRYSGTAKDILKCIDANYDLGKVYVVVGKSGNGKTTLLSVISGLDTATGGEVLFNGKNLAKTDRDKYRAKSIGVVFQSYNLLINATAFDNIILSMDISGVKMDDKKNYVYKLLEKVGIDKETANRKVLKLSGGEQQRIGIARAISHNPDIIIADEPTGNLDDDTQKYIMDILIKIAREDNKCVIIVTHSNIVSTYADEIWGLNDGKLIFVK
jgi:putative ABC transport system ATP-binding protein